MEWRDFSLLGLACANPQTTFQNIYLYPDKVNVVLRKYHLLHPLHQIIGVIIFFLSTLNLAKKFAPPPPVILIICDLFFISLLPHDLVTPPRVIFERSSNGTIKMNNGLFIHLLCSVGETCCICCGFQTIL